MNPELEYTRIVVYWIDVQDDFKTDKPKFQFNIFLQYKNSIGRRLLFLKFELMYHVFQSFVFFVSMKLC